MKTNKILIICHRDLDGYTSAFNVKKFYENSNSEISIFDYQYKETLTPDTIEKATQADYIYIVDFSFPDDEMKKLINTHAQIAVIDHHKTTNKNTFNDRVKIVYDIKECGATLSYKYFYPGVNIPTLLEYVKDRDLWIKELNQTEEYSLLLNDVIKGIDDESYQNYKNLIEDFYSYRLTPYIAILKEKNKTIEKLAKKYRMVNIAGYKVPAVNSSLYISEIGEYLYTHIAKDTFAVIYFDVEQKNGAIERVFGLRSSSTGIDVSTIATKFGGGGHAGAAGFSTPII